MFDIIVNGKVVAICIEPVVIIFKEALVRSLPTEMSLEVKKHVDTKPQPKETPEETPKDAGNN